MDYTESVKKLDGNAVGEFARMLYENSIAEYESTLAELVASGGQGNYERAAIMLEASLAQAEDRFYDGNENTRSMTVEHKNVQTLVGICVRHGKGGYVLPMLVCAAYGRTGGALAALDVAATEYIKARAEKDFDSVADVVDAYDRKFIKYGVLLEVNRTRALARLIRLAVYGKRVNKAAIRDILMDCDEAGPTLFEMYGEANAKTRTALARLLLVMKNDGRVREFLENTVAVDASLSVRRVLEERVRKAKSTPEFFERLMINGTALTCDEWRELLLDGKYAEVADRTFFCIREYGATSVLVYNNGDFLDMSDRVAEIDGDEPIYVLHPLDAPSSVADIFSMRIAQPFPQVSRPIFHIMSGEADCSYRFFGEMVSRKQFDSNRRRVGFVPCAAREGECYSQLFSAGGYSVVIQPDVFRESEVVCGKLVFYRTEDIVMIKGRAYAEQASPLAVTDVPRRAYSELVYAVYKLFKGSP